MADKKITALTALASLADEDLFVVVDDVAGTATSKKLTAADLLVYITSAQAFIDAIPEGADVLQVQVFS